MKTSAFALSVVLCLSANAATLPSLIPAPKTYELSRDKGLKPSDIKYIVANGAEMPVLYGHLDKLPRMETDAPGVKLVLDTTMSLPSAEGYTLSVSAKGAVVGAPSEAGLFYGAVSLARLLEEAEEKGQPVDAAVITDYPSLPVRAIHFDTKHHLDRTEYYYSLIDRLAQWKINTIIWELEDKLQYERRPECSAPNALSKQEMRAICDYAKERHIDINPLVQGLGHAGFILKKHWELRENPGSDWEFCPSNPETYELQFDLYLDAIEAMPHGKFLHIGGDEITEIGIDERCKATGLSPFQLQMVWLNKVCNFAKEHGRTPIFWDDMPLKYGNLWWVFHRGLSDEEVDANWHTEMLDQAVELFPKDCIYMRWHYGDPTIYAHLKVLEWYKNKGLKVMAATAAADGGSPYMPRYGSKIEHIYAFCKLAVDNNLNEGILATCWDDGSPHWETVLRGFAALSEFSWNPSSRSTSSFKEVFEQNHFGLYNGEAGFIEDLEAAASFFDGALITEGRRNPAWQVRKYRLIDLPDPEKPGEWTKKYAERIEAAAKQKKLCEQLKIRIDQASKKALRNRYPLEIYSRNNELFEFPANILLALKDVDLAKNADQRRKALDKLSAECEALDTIKKKLIRSYGKTRFMELPKGYIQDQNHHKHLAALTPDAEWLFLYENDIVRQIKKLK